MSVKYLDDYGYASDKLCGSYIQFNNKLYFFKSIDVAGNVRLLDNNAGKIVNVHLKDLDLTPPELGFCNYNKDAIWVARVPFRQFKQGLRSSNITSKAITKVYVPNLLGTSNIADTVNNKYPKIEHCLDLLFNEEVQSIAFSRKFAAANLGKSKGLFYKGKKVGAIREDNGKPVLDNKYMLLSESLEEILA